MNSLCLFLFCFSTFATGSVNSSPPKSKPNVVVFVVDDLGIGDVGCFGNKTIRTPNIDKIGKNGAIFTHHLAADGLCTPSRAALLTGRYPIRSGMACHNDAFPVIIFVSSRTGLPKEEVSFAKMAKNRGYSTALFGKWHQGLSCDEKTDFCHHPLTHGFDTFYGFPMSNMADFGPEGGGLTGFSNIAKRRYSFLELMKNTAIVSAIVSFLLAQRNLLNLKIILFLNALWLVPGLVTLWFLCNLKFLNSMILRNYELVEQPIRFENLTQRLVSEAVSFVEGTSSRKQPFLMVVSWFQVHIVLHTSSEFKGRSLHGQYGDNVEEMDWGVGQILEALERLDQLDNTFIYLTSDNGGSTEESGPGGGCHGGYNGIYRGNKGHNVMEGGIRVPAVAMWKDHIKPGTVINVPTSLMDIFPTLRDSVLNLDEPITSKPDEESVIDGKNIYPLLTGLGSHSPHKFLFHYCCREVQAVTYVSENDGNVYKIYYATPDCADGCGCDKLVTWQDPPLIYNLSCDPSEREGPLKTSDPLHKEILKQVVRGTEEHQESLKKKGGMRESQMTLFDMLPRPWLQPCCNFPYCKCSDLLYPNIRD